MKIEADSTATQVSPNTAKALALVASLADCTATSDHKVAEPTPPTPPTTMNVAFTQPDYHPQSP